MIIHKQLFFSESAEKQKEMLLRSLRKKEGTPKAYLLFLLEKEENGVLEFYSWQEYKKRERDMKKRILIGVAMNKNEAMELCRRIVDTVYQATGECRLWNYFSERK